MFHEIVSAMQLSEIKKVSGSVDLPVVPHGKTLAMSDKEQAAEASLTPGIGAQGSRRWNPWISLLTLFMIGVAAAAEPSRLVIFDDDFYGPAGTDLQAAVLLLNNADVKVLGLTVVSGDGWRDEEVAHTLRLLEIIHRTDIPVVPGAVFPLINTPDLSRISL